MLTIWTQHLKDQDEKDKFAAYVKNHKPILDRLQQILRDRDERQENTELEDASFDTPNWALKRANQDGRRAERKALLTIINLDQQKQGIQL